MPRSPMAYLSNIVEACDAIEHVLHGIDLAAYQDTRSIRSAVEREFILIGEAVRILGQIDPDAFARISHARMIVDFRNLLTHDYAAVDDETVLGFARSDVSVLREECVLLLDEAGRAGGP